MITLWGHFEAPYFKMLNDTSVASAGSFHRTCRRIRNSKKIATIRDFHQNICVNPTIEKDIVNKDIIDSRYFVSVSKRLTT